MAGGPGRHHPVRLLLDEHLSPEIARRLRELGHDVIAVGERTDLKGRSDRVHFAAQHDQRRAIVTRDLADFRPLLEAALRGGASTYGLVCVSHRFSLNRAQVGRIVRALEVLLTAHPADDAVIRLGGEIWLDDPGG